MKSRTPLVLPVLMILLMIVLCGALGSTDGKTLSAAEPKLAGRWEVTVAVRGKQRTAVLSLFSDPKGNQGGHWIGVGTQSELKDVKYEAGRLSFTAKGPNRDGQQTTWTFTGTIKKDKLSGTVSSSDRGEHMVAGKRIPPLPDIVGNYGFSYAKDEAIFSLAIRMNDKGKLTAEWLNVNGKVPITDLVYKEGKLTFKSKLGDYEGRLTQQKSLNGTYTTDKRAFSVLSMRLGKPMIGTWNLEVTSEQGSRHQRLEINRDMSGWYGAIPIKEVHLQGDDPHRPHRPRTVTFKTIVKSGEKAVEMSFAGKVTDAQLSGQLTTPSGTAKVSGKREVQ
jgi:hypothetical protein